MHFLSLEDSWKSTYFYHVINLYFIERQEKLFQKTNLREFFVKRKILESILGSKTCFPFFFKPTLNSKIEESIAELFFMNKLFLNF